MFSAEEAENSDKPIVIFPSRNGKIYETRRTFTAPAEILPEFPEVQSGFHLYDTLHHRYTIRVSQQELTHTSVHPIMEEDYPEYMIHVMDIHSHNTMLAKFSPIDDEDKKATRLYAVVGRLNKVFPDITVRVSCAGKFIPVCPEEVFETNYKAYPYPKMWDQKIEFNKETKTSQISDEFIMLNGKEASVDEIL